MTEAFDQRIIRLGLELEDGVATFENLYISAKGTQYGSGIMNECECIIFNLTKEHRNYLLTQTSPYNLNRSAKLMTLDVGRQSYGTFRLYEGNVIASQPTQPPDIGIVLRGLTGVLLMGSIIARNQPARSQLSTIARGVAEDTGTTLDFQATDKAIANYSYTGAALNQVNKLGEAGGVDAYITNGTLTVKDQGKPLPGEPRLISKETGMVGIPQVDEIGVSVRVMLDNSIRLGTKVTITSEMNPAANGTYTVYKMDFDVASRDTPFYYIIWCSNYPLPTL